MPVLTKAVVFSLGTLAQRHRTKVPSKGKNSLDISQLGHKTTRKALRTIGSTNKCSFNLTWMAHQSVFKYLLNYKSSTFFLLSSNAD